MGLYHGSTAVRPNVLDLRNRFIAAGNKQDGGSNGDGERMIDEDATFEKRELRKMPSPCRPSQEEVDKHNLTHCPYRSWCRHCVRGRGVEMARSLSNGVPGEVPEFSFDFCFPAEASGDGVIVRVGRLRHTRMTMGVMVPTKTTG